MGNQEERVAARILTLLQEAEQRLPLVPDVVPAADVLADAESLLPKPLSAHGSGDCDRWCRLWMLLVGSWYSLRWAAVFSDERPLLPRLRHGHLLARQHLEVLGRPQGLTSEDMGGWYAGFFLISAEHRIADGFERATKLFVADTPLEDLNVFPRCQWLTRCCPHCRAQHYLTDGLDIIRAFEHNAANPLVVVHKRVNALKHSGKRPVSDETTLLRLQEAAAALKMAALAFRALVRHKAACSMQSRSERGAG